MKPSINLKLNQICSLTNHTPKRNDQKQLKYPVQQNHQTSNERNLEQPQNNYYQVKESTHKKGQIPLTDPASSKYHIKSRHKQNHQHTSSWLKLVFLKI